jgi:uncharacterized integral membrane protein
MQVYLILALVIAILAVIFALQNVAVVSISFFTWSVNVSLAVALLVALGIGVLISILISIPDRVKSGWNVSKKNRKYSSLEEERDSLKQKIDEIIAERDRHIQKLADSEKEISDLELNLANFAAALHDAELKLSSAPHSSGEPSPEDETAEAESNPDLPSDEDDR